MTARLVPVPSGRVDTVWPTVEPLIEKALARGCGGYEPRDVRADLKDNTAQLWLAVDGKELLAAMVGRIAIYPRHKVYLLYLLAGRERERWLFLLDYLEPGARKRGCKALVAEGRKGWARVLEGWTETHVVLRKEL
jgi:hypothetical protein